MRRADPQHELDGDLLPSANPGAVGDLPADLDPGGAKVVEARVR
jgi:hypothetical protein